MSRISEQELRFLYLEEKKTDDEIGKFLGLKQQTVCYYRKKYHIKTLHPWERHICKPTRKQKQVIYGTLLGDGSLSDGKKAQYQGHSLLSVMHCEEQKEFVLWKYQHLSSLCTNPPKPTRKNAWWFKTIQHPFFSSMRSEWYDELGKKRVTQEILCKICDPIALAVWYMDDGFMTSVPNLSTCSFTEHEHDILVEWLKCAFGLRSHFWESKRGYLHLAIDSDRKFLNTVSDFTLPCFGHKV